MGIVQAINEIPSFWIRLEFWLVNVEVLLTTAGLLWAAWHIYKTSKYMWLVWQITLMLLANLCMLMANFAYTTEFNSSFLDANLTLDKILISFGTSGYNGFANLFHWLFSFEYLQVSFMCEITQNERRSSFVLNREDRVARHERTFSIIKYTGLVVNFLPAPLLCYCYYVKEQMLYDFYRYGTPLNPSIIVLGISC
jgi:hypothetical protein